MVSTYSILVITAHQAKQSGHHLPQSYDEVLRLATRIHVQKKSFRVDSFDDSDSDSDDSSISTGKTCSHHGPNSSHVSKDCRVLNSNIRLSRPDKGKGTAPGWRSFNPTSFSSATSNICRYCKKVPYVLGHRCPEGAAHFATLKKPSLNALDIDQQPCRSDHG
ncbi:hypothetical protein BCR42DRAFT_444031 [Absidia repens]|uniref:Uncharacterized protein n=1 Tax=Absidia repens TaxID=90262 RepID=A0A1X2HZ03_9FUNG|nr:hypothetical protein BCR42DRAFT_444031 [Absidia repens]